MANVLPNYSAPNVSLQVNGLSYYYLMTKETDEEVSVYIRNVDPINGGYVFEEVDDWSGLPSNSIQKYFRFQGIEADRWGPGEISVEGNGVVSEQSVIYLYRMDIDQQEIICTSPMISPECPGFFDAEDKYEDPYNDELVQDQLNRETYDQEEAEDSVLQQDDELEKRLKTDPNVGGLINVEAQNYLMTQLSQVYKLDPYYIVEIDGKEYNDTNILEDNNLPDNNRALRQLASDAKHYSMVRSQYDENNNGE